MSKQNPNQMQSIDPEIVQAEIESTIASATEPLRSEIEMPKHMFSQETERELGERITKIAGIVQANSERVIADMDKPAQKRTEHDPERAHLMALTTDGNETKLANAARREAEGKFILPGHDKRVVSNMLGAKLGANLAESVYNHDPLQAGVNSIRYQKINAINTGNKHYRTIDSGDKIESTRGQTGPIGRLLW